MITGLRGQKKKSASHNVMIAGPGFNKNFCFILRAFVVEPVGVFRFCCVVKVLFVLCVDRGVWRVV